MRGRAPVFVLTYMWLFVIYTYSLSLFIQWFQFIYDISIVCLHFTCESDCAGDFRPVCAVAFYKCDFGNACFSVSVCASVELWRLWRTDAAGVGIRISIFVLVSLFLSVYVWAFIYIHVFLFGVRRAAGARPNSCYTQVTPSRVIHECLRVFAFHLCVRLCTVLFQVLVICLWCLQSMSVCECCPFIYVFVGVQFCFKFL